MTAPFQWMKQIASHLGGTHNPMVLTWPADITDRGAIREQFTHVNDLAPTILELAGIAQPDTVEGVAQLPMDGTCLAYSSADPEAPERHETQYFEANGHRSIYHRGWMASAHHGGVPWTAGRRGTPRPFEDDEWELYELRSDFSQAHDLAQQEPERLAELTALVTEHAERVGILPLHDARVSRTPMPNLVEDRTSFTFHAGTVGIPESRAPRMVGRSWHLRAVRDVGEGTAQGVVASMGGRAAGWALWLARTAGLCWPTALSR
ncbi:sulfatase/phosphatase domain-containing protein [Streptomyces sp. NPDC057486]|uniref:sulfatase/phosphatase domain-containing protein n=1 Tax=Streptomyces sp. NPDC057486 TaxID=3346145 RepID=UPI00368BCC86